MHREYSMKSLVSRMFDNYLKMKIFFSNNLLVGCIVRGLVGILKLSM